MLTDLDLVLLGLLIVAIASMILLGTIAGRRNIQVQVWKRRYLRAIGDRSLRHQLVITQPDGNVITMPLTAQSHPAIDVEGEQGMYRICVEPKPLPS